MKVTNGKGVTNPITFETNNVRDKKNDVYLCNENTKNGKRYAYQIFFISCVHADEHQHERCEENAIRRRMADSDKRSTQCCAYSV